MNKTDLKFLIEETDTITVDEKIRLLKLLGKNKLTKEDRDLIVEKSEDQDKLDQKELEKLEKEINQAREKKSRFDKFVDKILDQVITIEEKESEKRFGELEKELGSKRKKAEEDLLEEEKIYEEEYKELLKLTKDKQLEEVRKKLK